MDGVNQCLLGNAIHSIIAECHGGNFNTYFSYTLVCDGQLSQCFILRRQVQLVDLEGMAGFVGLGENKTSILESGARDSQYPFRLRSTRPWCPFFGCICEIVDVF